MGLAQKPAREDDDRVAISIKAIRCCPGQATIFALGRRKLEREEQAVSR